MLTRTFDLNLSPGGALLQIPVSQNDTASRTLVFNLFSSDGLISLPTGTAAQIRGKRPDGVGFSNAASLSGTAVTVTVTEQMAAVAGKVLCEIVLYKGTASSVDYQQISTANFIIHVKHTARFN